MTVFSFRLLARSRVLWSHIFTTNLFCNGIVLDHVLYSFGRNYARNVQSKHQRAETFLSSSSLVKFLLFFIYFFFYINYFSKQQKNQHKNF